jgi:threonine/homoserine/homoserine lactone efflux protein
MRAFVFGLTLGAAIGPIALLILNFALTRGFLVGAACAIGSTVADFIFAVLAFGAGHVLSPVLEAHRALLGAVAGIALLAIGGRVLIDGMRDVRGRKVEAAIAKKDRNPVLTTFVLTLVNPMTIIGFAAFGAQLDLAGSWLAVLGNALAAVAGTCAVSVAIAAAGGALAPRLKTSNAIGWLNLVSGAAIAAFGVAGLAR